MENNKQTRLSDVMRDSQNCVQLHCFTCNTCGFNLGSVEMGAANCPATGCDGALEAEQPIVVGRKVCNHTFNGDGHAYVPNE